MIRERIYFWRVRDRGWFIGHVYIHFYVFIGFMTLGDKVPSQITSAC
jgi:hypothetical protein